MTAMYIMTSKNMNKRVYIDDVIDKVSLFVRFQLQNTIYPSYDPVYRFVLICNFFFCLSLRKILEEYPVRTNILVKDGRISVD